MATTQGHYEKDITNKENNIMTGERLEHLLLKREKIFELEDLLPIEDIILKIDKQIQNQYNKIGLEVEKQIDKH